MYLHTLFKIDDGLRQAAYAGLGRDMIQWGGMIGATESKARRLMVQAQRDAHACQLAAQTRSRAETHKWRVEALRYHLLGRVIRQSLGGGILG